MVAITSPASEPDLVELIFEYIMADFPDLAERLSFIKEATRKEFAGLGAYIPQRSSIERQNMVDEVMRLFNGRNAREIARRLRISRATVYRLIKTSGR